MKWKSLYRLCALILALAALTIVAFAEASIEEQMAANSAAWHIAKANGDEATCAALHAANESLAKQAAGSTGTASYNSSRGTWDITTSDGTRITSSGSSSGGKSTNITYTTTTSSGKISSTSSRTYSESSINAYLGTGGTKQGLQDSYNTSAARVTEEHDYGDWEQITSADDEAAVAKVLLGLTDAETAKLKSDLEVAKQAYASADTDYKEALARGDTAAAEKAKAMMEEAHAESQSIRESYGYTGDTEDVYNGGYYYDIFGRKIETGTNSSTKSGGGSFFFKDGLKYYSIYASCNSGGTISPSGSLRVEKGSSKAFTITPDSGYEIQKIVVDETEKAITKSYAFTNIQSSHTITVTFGKIKPKITATAGEGGTISPDGEIEISTKLGADETKTFTITPDTGYKIKDVLVDGESVGAVTSYSFHRVRSSHTIHAEFMQKSIIISAYVSSGGKMETVTANGGKTVKSSERISVPYGKNQTFSILPDAGYSVAKVSVDGVNKGAISSYTFSQVKEAHSISVTFAQGGTVKLGSITLTDTLGTNLAGKSMKSGYGFMVKVPVEAVGVTDVKVKLKYNFGTGQKSVTLQKSGSDYVCPVNASSPTKCRCVYVPAGTADAEYTLTVEVTAKNTAGAVLSDTAAAKLTIRGVMYEDDFTGDS